MKNPSKGFSKLVVGLFVLVFALFFVNFIETGRFHDPGLAEAVGAKEDLPLDESNPGIQVAMDVQESNTPALMALSGVVGIAVGADSEGNPVIQVFVDSEGVRGIPRDLDGFRVVTKVTGPIIAYKGPPGGDGPPGGGGNNGGGGGVSHTAIQEGPILLGTSGGWGLDLANGYCCGGTLGSLVSNGTAKYILSNYHVFYADIEPGGNGIIAQAGDSVIQPGLIDASCGVENTQGVATLVTDGGSLPDANVDAGIAQVVSGRVDDSGAILEIGTISSQTVAATINQPVKKSGRTTGLSTSTVDGLNATVSITYSNECAGGSAFTKVFTGQIIIKNKRCKFLDGGDSGSLMVEDVDANPRAVGLLFAGSSVCGGQAIGVANPIDDVLTHLGSTFQGSWSMVGN